MILLQCIAVFFRGSTAAVSCCSLPWLQSQIVQKSDGHIPASDQALKHVSSMTQTWLIYAYIYIYLPMLYVQRYMQINKCIYIYTYTQFHWSKDPWIFMAPLDSPFPSPSSHSRPQDLSVLPNFASEGHGQVDTDRSQMNTCPLVN